MVTTVSLCVCPMFPALASSLYDILVMCVSVNVTFLEENLERIYIHKEENKLSIIPLLRGKVGILKRYFLPSIYFMILHHVAQRETKTKI